MKLLLKIEELFFVLLSLFLFRKLDYFWWVFAVFFMAPDLGMLGYLAGPRVGAISYNLLHHRAIAIAAYLGGVFLNLPDLLITRRFLLPVPSRIM